MTRTLRKRGYAFLLALLVVGVVIALLALPSKQQPESATPPVVSQKQPTRTAAAVMPQSAPVATETVSAKVDRLTQSGKNNPADAFAAYEVVATCVLLEGLHKAISGAMPSEDTESLRKAWAQRDADRKDCETLSQRQRVDRFANLTVAVKAGVPGAGLAFYREGPAGDQDALQSRPTDPLVVEWKTAAISYVYRDAIERRHQCAVGHVGHL